MRNRWQRDVDAIAGPNNAAENNDTHNTCFSDEMPIRIFVGHPFEQSRPEGFDLLSRIAQARETDEGRCADLQRRAGWQ